MGCAIGVASILIGSLSILRRGRIKVDREEARIEFSGGFRKLRASPRVIPFEEISEILIRSSVGRHTSYAVDVVIKGGPDLVLDQTSSATYARELGGKLAGTIGCEVRESGGGASVTR